MMSDSLDHLLEETTNHRLHVNHKKERESFKIKRNNDINNCNNIITPTINDIK